uniref:Uncharacterized protein n=1 Tax=Parascaris equorum TaxID=6256 RepID=A0A914S6S5_PAREQ
MPRPDNRGTFPLGALTANKAFSEENGSLPSQIPAPPQISQRSCSTCFRAAPSCCRFSACWLIYFCGPRRLLEGCSSPFAGRPGIASTSELKPQCWGDCSERASKTAGVIFSTAIWSVRCFNEQTCNPCMEMPEIMPRVWLKGTVEPLASSVNSLQSCMIIILNDERANVP